MNPFPGAQANAYGPSPVVDGSIDQLAVDPMAFQRLPPQQQQTILAAKQAQMYNQQNFMDTNMINASMPSPTGMPFRPPMNTMLPQQQQQQQLLLAKQQQQMMLQRMDDNQRRQFFMMQQQQQLMQMQQPPNQQQPRPPQQPSTKPTPSSMAMSTTPTSTTHPSSPRKSELSLDKKIDLEMYAKRVEAILAMNQEIIRLCIENQSAAMQDPSLSIYQARLQSNLTYLATMADLHKSGDDFKAPAPPDLSELPAPKSATATRIQQLLSTTQSYFKQDGTSQERLSDQASAASTHSPSDAHHTPQQPSTPQHAPGTPQGQQSVPPSPSHASPHSQSMPPNQLAQHSPQSAHQNTPHMPNQSTPQLSHSTPHIPPQSTPQMRIQQSPAPQTMQAAPHMPQPQASQPGNFSQQQLQQQQQMMIALRQQQLQLQQQQHQQQNKPASSLSMPMLMGNMDPQLFFRQQLQQQMQASPQQSQAFPQSQPQHQQQAMMANVTQPFPMNGMITPDMMMHGNPMPSSPGAMSLPSSSTPHRPSSASAGTPPAASTPISAPTPPAVSAQTMNPADLMNGMVHPSLMVNPAAMMNMYSPGMPDPSGNNYQDVMMMMQRSQQQ
ncbi:hypothetical protein DM01DRAFT_1335694 [Hesseltinella vesiculosa]|uniref:Uncharacterized protein n=1 Tax=Hesseltinella vesiculosa TaxID=101127 RepID=A0A1X2GIN0_9FUNG|nr:hypothetical protein DM01DRAFT_1335694 [Hesseltinella vesiculosa]